MRNPIIAALATLCLGATLAFILPQATFAAGPGNAAGGRLQKIAEVLNLTPGQKTQIKPILISTRDQVKAFRQDTTLSPAARQAKLTTIREGAWQQIRALLAPEQKAKLAALRQRAKSAGAA